MTLSLRAGLSALAVLMLLGCSSTSDEVRRKCATSADPAACQRAEAQKQRAADGDRLMENSVNRGGY
jgi:hypothetical protein